jgi:hypothetical protein
MGLYIALTIVIPFIMGAAVDGWCQGWRDGRNAINRKKSKL